jgi:hypothetical protein
MLNVRYDSDVDYLMVYTRTGVPNLGHCDPSCDDATYFRAKSDESYVGFHLQNACDNLDYVKHNKELTDNDKICVLLEMLKTKHGKE